MALFKRKTHDACDNEPPLPALPSYSRLAELMKRYTVDQLVGVEPDQFKQRIDQFLQLQDYEMEGYDTDEGQRDLSVKFMWGHDHDFGDFKLEGRMQDRHLRMVATFIDEFPVLGKSLEGKRVLDIGGWTGGISLLLCAMGAKVVMIEEVRKYVDCVNYLRQAFGLEDQLEARCMSLYECKGDDFHEQFDYVMFAGVLYHVTDLIVALRITFNCLVDGGQVMIETGAEKSDDQILRYYGPECVNEGDAGQRNRGGWNWFMPSPSALAKMMTDVGFEDIATSPVRYQRTFAAGRRKRHVEILRAGLADRTLR